MFFKRVAGLIVFALGFLGVVACLAGAYGVWVIAVRLHDANDRVFAAVDRGLSKTEERVTAVQKRVEQSKITTIEVRDKIRNWGAAEAKERLVERLEIDAQAEKLILQLETADSWLDASAETIRGVQHL